MLTRGNKKMNCMIDACQDEAYVNRGISVDNCKPEENLLLQQHGLGTVDQRQGMEK